MRQPVLFDDPRAAERSHRVILSEAPAEVAYFPNFLSSQAATGYFDELRTTVAWRDDDVLMYGRMLRVPRLTAWYGDRGREYRFSGTRHHARAWTPALLALKSEIEAFTGDDAFNSVLLNLYRSGADSVAWHADDERELGPHPVIASLSLGTPRTFAMRANDRSTSFSVVLEHGSLLLMGGLCQRVFQHAVPKEPRITGERINLTFRRISGVPPISR